MLLLFLFFFLNMANILSVFGVIYIVESSSFATKRRNLKDEIASRLKLGVFKTAAYSSAEPSRWRRASYMKIAAATDTLSD